MFPPPIEIPVTDSFRSPEETTILTELGWSAFSLLGIKQTSIPCS